jgi:rhamnogalacturonyl hydrolase YesR
MARKTAEYPFKRWGFGESIDMEGMLAAGGEAERFAARLVTGWAVDRAPLRNDPLAHIAPLRNDPLAHIAPGVPLLVLAERDGADRPALLARAWELAGLLAGCAAGRHGAQIHRPDLAGWEHEVWVDCMHLDGPFLVRLARITDDDRHADLAVEILLGHARVLHDERSGLFSHGFDDAAGQPNGIHWGRGQGWALLGLVDTAAGLQERHPARAEIVQRLRALVEGLALTEAGPGAWRTVVDVPETYIEASVGAFVALGVGRAIRHGLVPRDWEPLVDRAWEATAALIAADGSLPGVSDATPVGPDAAHYGARPVGVFPWGQGPALLAAVERLESEARDG